MKMRATILAYLAAMALSYAAAATATGPAEVIQEASTMMLEALAENRDLFSRDRDALYSAVDDILLPRFDQQYSGGLVMGKYWRRANPEQRQRFITALYRSLLQTYAEGILEYRGDQLEVLPVDGDLSKGKALVETLVTLDTGVVTPVNYRMRLKDGQWKAYDVVIEGISYVSNYRSQYAGEFRAKGIDAVIEELEAKSGGPAGDAQ
ncbi:MAG: ABC transporter substrate-binding protein [Chromatiales bacterium]|jgi:phospholipid transport system substrate-binding protein|nr:ABC transporter substrate-binding protein [Chromatiales bacterium]